MKNEFDELHHQSLCNQYSLSVNCEGIHFDFQSLLTEIFTQLIPQIAMGLRAYCFCGEMLINIKIDAHATKNNESKK